MQLVSVAAYARLHGVSKPAAQKWQARNLLVFRDGKVAVELSDQNLQHAGVGRFKDGATPGNRQPERQPAGQPPRQPEPDNPVAAAAEAAREEAELGEGEPLNEHALFVFVERLLAGGYSPLIEAQTIKENALALKRVLEARKAAGELIELSVAEQAMFDVFRSSRDAWLNFAPSIGPLLAADLGLEAEKVTEALAGYVHRQLTDLGEPSLQPAEGREAQA